MNRGWGGGDEAVGVAPRSLPRPPVSARGDVQRDVQRSLLPCDRAEMTRGPVCVGGTGRKANL